MLKIVPNDADRDGLAATLDELVAEGARQMLIAGLEAEVADYVARHQGLVDEAGHRMVVRNGRAEERSLVTGAGLLKVRAPRVNDRREGRLFSSYILPKYARKSPKVADVLPVLYLRGLSTGDFAPALAEFFGSDTGLSATSITRLLETWTDEYTAFESRDLSSNDYVYVWADGVHFRIRLEEDRLSCLVVIGVRSDGTKELLACSDGYRESTESWADVLRDLKARGMTAPAVAVGDGALGFWSALGDVFPETAEQRCWVHKTANILNVLPKRLHRQAKAAIHEIYQAETRADAEAGIDDFARLYADKYPKAVAKLTKDRDVLLTFYDYPAAHWVHLRTTNPIESTFATVRARTRVTKGAGSRRRGLVMAYKLLDAAQDRWRKVNSPELVIQVRAGIEFKDGIRVERRTQESRDAA
ncbi:MAG: IS256 family transposase [Actinomycetota bacterium]|nr:IS256 family transposase [Actinomycetota bacterium]